MNKNKQMTAKDHDHANVSFSRVLNGLMLIRSYSYVFAFGCLLVAGFFTADAHADILGRSEKASASNAISAARKNDWSLAREEGRNAGPMIATMIDWLYFKSPQSGASADDIIQFLNRHPGWPSEDALRARAEMALLREAGNSARARGWLEDKPPVSGAGKLALAIAMQEDGAKGYESLVREGWREADLDEKSESDMMARFPSLITAELNAARLDRLLWEEKTKAAERMLPLVSAGKGDIARARISLQRNENAGPAMAALATKDTGLLFDLANWNHKRGNALTAEKLLLEAPANVPYPEKWWPLRERYARKALESGNWQKALRLVKNHGLKEGSEAVEAHWLAGWIIHRFQSDPRESYKSFYSLFNTATTPVSKARAAFFAGNAARLNKNPDISRNWFEEAAKFPTTFYGQLAHQELHGKAPLKIEESAALSQSQKQAYAKQELPRLAMALGEIDENTYASQFFTHLITEAKDATQSKLAAWASAESGLRHEGVRAAKKALQFSHTVLLESGFPVIKTHGDIPIEPALALAISRQESEFNDSAKSSAGALGLMQLLPSTANEVARKNGLGYSRERLYESAYNMQLGSLYLSKMIDKFNGSYILAIASYNAGPGRVNQWVNEMGAPSNNVDEAIAWVEAIPYRETRNYVQRVLENLQVYRYRLSNGKADLAIEQDLTR